MKLPLQITFRNMRHSIAVASRVRAEVAKLDRCFNRITSCHVVVEAPHRHHRYGGPFHLRIILSVPLTEIVVEHTPSLHSTLARMDTAKWLKHLETGEAYKEINVAIREAFRAARRRLEDYARCLRGDVKVHPRKSPIHAEKLLRANSVS